MDQQRGTGYEMYDPKLMRSSKNWRTPSGPFPLQRITSYKGPTEYEFVYDYDSIALGFIPTQHAEDYPRLYLGYPTPLPDSPPVCTRGHRGQGICRCGVMPAACLEGVILQNPHTLHVSKESRLTMQMACEEARSLRLRAL